MNTQKEALIAKIMADKAARTIGGTHCSNCGHCKHTL